MTTATKKVVKKVTKNRIAGNGSAVAAGLVELRVPELRIGTLNVRLTGTTQLVTHAWSEKGKRQMLAAQQKTAKSGREPKCPEEDFWGSMHHLDGPKPTFETDKKSGMKIVDHKQLARCCSEGSFGVPSIMLKKSMIGACRFVDGIAMTEVRGAVFVEGVEDVSKCSWDSKEFLKIDGANPIMREDIVRVGKGVADLRYRASFFPWTIDARITFNADFFKADQVYNLLRIAGFSQGLGEFRAERGGSWGAFEPDVM